ncbi:MAG: molecular chaperone DnaK [Verrucomicrobiales bacterium]|jgi:molecular chaperone DnaK
MSKHIGIDLGTSTSGLAYLRADGNPEIVPNADGERLTPSVVYFDAHEEIKLVGSAARDGGDPDRTVYGIKRSMDDPDFVVMIDGEKWTPTEISAIILAKLKRDCSAIIGDFKDAVITVPANFNELARTATINAAKIAGLNVLRIVNEPTAAALYYAHAKSVSGRILVYDLGGGTLDVTLVEVDAVNDTYRILLSEGARHLGGNHFDEEILDLYAEQYREQKGGELYTNELERRRALQSGEDAKKMLSKLQQVNGTVGNKDRGLARVELTRDLFEGAVKRLLTRTVMLVEQALDTVNLTPQDIDHVVLVGGSTRMPMVRRTLEETFGFKTMSCGNVDECVALGAALFAKKASVVSEVCNHGYGTLALVDDPVTGNESLQNSVVIPKNTPIPCSISEVYATSEDNETSIEVDITQGEDEDPRFVDVIGRITLQVPEGRPAGCKVTVSYAYDENQRVQARVTDEETGISKEIQIEYKGEGVLSEEEVERKAAFLKKLRIE